MSKRILTEEQINILLQNPNVERCSKKSITYDKSFKVEAIKQHQEGLPPNEIFRQADFDISTIGRETPKRCLQNWRKTVKQKGVQALSVETRGTGGGRPKTKWHNDQEKIKYLKAQVAYLKAENGFLARLRKQRLN